MNLCLAGKKHNYEPHIWTPYHHKSFPETHDGSIRIHEHGSFFGLVPDTIFGRFKGILAYIRSIICTLWLALFNQYEYSVVVADQVSVVLPILRFFGYRTIFYCHFPDKLLAGSRQNLLKIMYRFVIDLVEEISLIFANKIYVNSEYTKDIFYKNFKILKRFGVNVEVLYPALDFSQFDKEITETEGIKKMKTEINGKYFFSLNRYERKKNINLAIKAFSHMIKKHREKSNSIKLVIAGGYDPKVI